MKLVFKTLSLGSALLAAMPAYAEDIYVALPEQAMTDAKTMIDIARTSFDAAGAGDHLSILNVDDGRAVITMDVDDKPRYNNPKFKNKDYAKPLSTLKSFIGQANGNPATSFADFKSDIPTTLEAIGDLRAGSAEPVHILIVASGLHQVPQNPSLSMYSENGTVLIPSAGFLLGDKILSPFGQGTDRDFLKNSYLHLCLTLPPVTSHEKEQVGEFWGNYAALRGGAVVNYSTDIKSCLKGFKARVTTPMKLAPLNPELPPAMIAADMTTRATRVTINAMQDLEDKLERETKAKDAKIADLTGKLEASETAKGRAETKRDQYRKELERYKIALGQNSGEVTDFSKFTSVPHPTIGSLTITTGVGYDQGFPDRYESSWCYFNRDNAQGANIRIDVGAKKPRGRITWETVSNTVLREVGLTQAEFKVARKSCRFPQT